MNITPWRFTQIFVVVYISILSSLSFFLGGILYGYTIVYLTTHPLKDIWVVSMWGLLWICKAGLNINVDLFVNMFPLILDKYSGVQFLDHMVIVCLVINKLPVFHNGYTILCSHQQCMSKPFSPCWSFTNWLPYTEDKEGWEKEADHPDLWVVDLIFKHQNLESYINT